MSRPWMPLYVADYLADTGHLSTVEHGAYLLLIMHYWQKGGLPDDDKRLASIARASLEQWQEIRPALLDLFQSGWKHSRIDDELEKSAKAYEKRAAAGKAGGEAKAAASNARAKLKRKPSNALPSTITTTLKEEGSNEPSSSEPEKSAPSEIVVVSLPTVSEGEVPIFETDVAEWQPAFPGVNVNQQLQAMRSWLLANPTKRKTKRGMRKFVVTWLDKRQNAAPTPRAASPPTRAGIADAAQRIIESRANGSEIFPVNHGHAERLSAEPSDKPRAAVEDLRGGIGRRFGGGNH